MQSRVPGGVAPPRFNPRSPRGGATSKKEKGEKSEKFQSTLPTRGSDDIMLHLIEQVRVSIHAPHEGERLAGVGLTSTSDGFQSTLPTRGSDFNII